MISPTHEATLTRALRDIADGHLVVYRRADGTNSPDRLLAGAPARWWLILEERGQYLPPVSGNGPWRLA
jgi:hypothetical protein